MKERIYITIMLLFVFSTFFIFTTFLTDSIARTKGYYQQGIQDEQELEHEFN